jgi:hypothetical protein
VEDEKQASSPQKIVLTAFRQVSQYRGALSC